MKKPQINWLWAILLCIATSTASASIDVNDIKRALKWGESASAIAQRLYNAGEVPLLISQAIAQAAPQSAATVAALMAQFVPDNAVPNLAATTAKLVPSAASKIATKVADAVPQYVSLLVQIAEAVIKAVPESKVAVEAALKTKIAAANVAEKSEMQNALAGKGAGIVAMVEGSAYLLTPNGKRQKVSIGTELSNGITIVTAKGASVLVHNPDDSSYIVKENSRFKIKHYYFEESKPKKDKSIFHLAEGFLRFVSGIIAKRSPDKVEYQTPTMTAGVRGTEASIIYNSSDKQNYIELSQGKLLLKSLLNNRQSFIKSGSYRFTLSGIRERKNIPASIKNRFKNTLSMRAESRKAADLVYKRLKILSANLMRGRELFKSNQIGNSRKNLKKLWAILDKGTTHSKQNWRGIRYRISNDPLQKKCFSLHAHIRDYTNLVKSGVRPLEAHRIILKKYGQQKSRSSFRPRFMQRFSD
jgi:hypothetical protein